VTFPSIHRGPQSFFGGRPSIFEPMTEAAICDGMGWDGMGWDGMGLC
jgi:hypothetical protein